MPNTIKISVPKLPKVNVEKHMNKIEKVFSKFKDKLIYNIIATLVFSIIYYVIGLIDKNAFSEELEYKQALYFASTTNFTLGFGDVLPKSNCARFIVVIHSILFYVITIAA